MFTETRKAQAHTTYCTTLNGADVRLPTLICSHCRWSQIFQVQVAAQVTIDGIIGAQVHLHFDILRRPTRPYRVSIQRPSGYDPLPVDAFVATYPASSIRQTFERQTVVIETKSRITKHTSIFEADMIAWLTGECARQQERLRWGLPTSENRTYIDLSTPFLHSTPDPNDHEHMADYRADMERERQFKDYWAKQHNPQPVFVA